jgi:hypothetical protein
LTPADSERSVVDVTSAAQPDQNALIVLACEYASLHADETFSVVRGGIDFWVLPTVPAPIALVLLLVIPGGVLPNGEHDLEFRLTTASGATVWSVQGRAKVKDVRFPVRGTHALEATIDAYGPASIEVSCGEARGRAMLEFRRPVDP